jgi:hypothetical protein
MNKMELWLRLKNYHFEHIISPGLWDLIRENFGGPDASTKAFASKIARKHGWNKPFALRAILEYKKFVYLGLVSDFYVFLPDLSISYGMSIYCLPKHMMISAKILLRKTFIITPN